jgi:TonB-linked SusC/RagA family outer membrane protein
LDLIIRRDGSTKFGDDKKWGNFPGLSAKWIISDEPFMAGTRKWMNMFAFRPSWGISGNQPDQEYLFYSRYAAYGDYMNLSAVKPSSLQLKSLKWEKTSSYNLGMDIEFFDGKYIFDLNYYYKKTDDLLQKNLSVPSTSGYSVLTYQNVGSIENKGWEINFTGNKIVKINDFSFSCNFNLGNNKNTILSLDPKVLASKNPDYYYKNGEYLSRIQENNSFGSIYGFRYLGVYQYDEYLPEKGQLDAPVARNESGEVILGNNGKPLPMVFGYGVQSNTDEPLYKFRGGDAKYEDINHDGNIDKLDIVYLGNSNPKITGGFMTSFAYKQFMVTAFFNFRYGSKIVNAARMDLENMYGDNNQSIAVNYRWRKNGDITDMPRALYNYGYNWLGSDRYVEDGSFLRFKDLTFRYTVKKTTLSKFNLTDLNIYLTINNLAVFSKYTGVDPEVGYGAWGVSKDANKTPRSKGFTLGVTVGL